MCADGLTAPFPVYGSNNWYYAYGSSSQREIEEDTLHRRLALRGQRKPPLHGDRRRLVAQPEERPLGPRRRNLPRYGRTRRVYPGAQNVRPGIWVRYIYDENHVCGVPDDWHMAHDASFLDPSRPEVLEYIRETTRRFVRWGYQLIKFDCSTQDILGRRGYKVPYVVAEDGWHFQDRSRTSAEIIVDFASRGARSRGRGNDPHRLRDDSASLRGAYPGRTGADVNGRNWDITRRMGVNTLAFRMLENGSFFAADADCVGITGLFPWRFAGQWLDLLAESGTPMFVSCKPGILDEAQARAAAPRLRAQFRAEGYAHPAGLDGKRLSRALAA